MKLKDTELRGVILKKYYDKRRQGLFSWETEDFADLDPTIDIDERDLLCICDQLGENGLIDWHPIPGHGGQCSIGGVGKITAYGVDVIEGVEESSLQIKLVDSSQHYSITGSSNVQIGNHNHLENNVTIGQIAEAINKADVPEEQKKEARSILTKALEHPLVSALVGAAAQAAAVTLTSKK